MPVEDKENSVKNKRRLNNNSSHASIIRRDLVLPTFDRTLIVEKTHFENEDIPKDDNNIEVIVEDCSPPNTITPSASAPNLTTSTLEKKKPHKSEVI